ncbi:MAG: AAA family ATPase [Candidatus Methanoperedens sp.]|nr:AAA family ATPase [Candidatus Methanoperedens sp.]
MGSEIIYRDESDEIKKLNGWILIYGRRKVGKTFLIKNFLDYDVFFRVNRDGSILAEKFVISTINNMDDFSRAVSELLLADKKVVIDEFQRLPESVIERISTLHPKGKVIFSGSSMRVIKKLFGSKSPLPGLAMQYKLGLIRPVNILRELSKKMDAMQAIELAPYLADAWTIPFFTTESDREKVIYDLLKYSKFTVPSLVGEIFTEEEREFTKVYEAILRLIGAGELDYKNIASILAGRKVIGRADSSLIIPYIKNMEGMGLVESLPIFSSKKKMYRLSSPIMEAFFYLADRYGFEDRDVSFEEARPTIEKLRNFAVQNFIGDLFASAYHGKKEYYVTPSKEIDFIITVRNKAVLIGEVKWGEYDGNDLKKFVEKSTFIKAEKIFITKNKNETKMDTVKIMDVNDILAMVK